MIASKSASYHNLLQVIKKADFTGEHWDTGSDNVRGGVGGESGPPVLGRQEEDQTQGNPSLVLAPLPKHNIFKNRASFFYIH